MQYPTNWEIDLDKKAYLIFISIVLFLFFCYEYNLITRLLADQFYNDGLSSLDKINSPVKLTLLDKTIVYEKALKQFNNSAMINPLDSRAYFSSGETIAEIIKDKDLSANFELDYNQTKAKYLEAVLREPTNAIYHQRLGSVFNRLADPERAQKEFNAAVKLDPQNIKIHFYLSQYYFFKGDEPEFLYNLNKALKSGEMRGEISKFLKSIKREELLE